jgi:hypothetical protein
MVELVLKNGGLVIKDGKLLVGDPSCCCDKCYGPCDISGGTGVCPVGCICMCTTKGEPPQCGTPNFCSGSATLQCGPSPELPIKVYRTGGTSGIRSGGATGGLFPGGAFWITGCGHALIGTIKNLNDTIDVIAEGPATVYSSIEAQAVDACSRLVFSGHNLTNGSPDAQVTVSYADCAVDFPFVNKAPDWCNNPMGGCCCTDSNQVTPETNQYDCERNGNKWSTSCMCTVKQTIVKVCNGCCPPAVPGVSVDINNIEKLGVTDAVIIKRNASVECQNIDFCQTPQVFPINPCESGGDVDYSFKLQSLCPKQNPYMPICQNIPIFETGPGLPDLPNDPNLYDINNQCMISGDGLMGVGKIIKGPYAGWYLVRTQWFTACGS